MLKLDRLDNWCTFVVYVGEKRFIDDDSSIPASIYLEDKEFYTKWWDARKERIAKRMSKMLLES